MKSQIRIEVDHDNQPIIKIQYVETDDVRDKLVKKFLETFGGSSCWATFYYEGSPLDKNKTAYIRPIHPTDLPEAVKPIITEAEKHAKLQSK